MQQLLLSCRSASCFTMDMGECLRESLKPKCKQAHVIQAFEALIQQHKRNNDIFFFTLKVTSHS